MPAHDGTAHARTPGWRRRPATTLSPEVLGKATLYSSAEPCAMCAGRDLLGRGSAGWSMA